MKRLRPHLTFANIAVVLLVAFTFTPLAHASAAAADDLTTQVAKALKLSKSANKNSKKALATAKEALAKGGPVGPAGPAGPPGPVGSPDTAAQVLGKLLDVDGASSQLDADLLDGLDATTFARSASIRSGFVASHGVIYNSTPGVTATRNSVGDYRLDFGSTNDLCALSVSAEDEFSFVRLVFVDGASGWDVEFANTAGGLADRAFDFVAICRTGVMAPARP